MKKTKISSLLLISGCVFAASMFLGYLGSVIMSGAPILRRDTTPNQRLPASNDTVYELAIPVGATTPVVLEEPEPVEVMPEIFEEFYLVRENDGRIGVFAHQNGEVHFLYNIDTLVRFLPEADRTLLQQGIVFYTLEELTQFEEDFSS